MQKIKVFSGGPVNQDNLFFIHEEPEIIKIVDFVMTIYVSEEIMKNLLK